MTRFSVLARSICCSRASCHLRNDTLTGSVLHDSGAFTPIGQLTAVPYEYYDRGRVETESAHAPIITAAVLQHRRIFFWRGARGYSPPNLPPPTSSWRDYLAPLECKKKNLAAGAPRPDPAWVAYSAPPDFLAGGEGTCCPIPRTHATLGPLGLRLQPSPLIRNRRLGCY